MGRGGAVCRGVWRETLYRRRGLEKKDLLPAFLPVVLLLLVSSEDCRIPQTFYPYVFAKVWPCLQEITYRRGPLSFLLLSLKSLPSAHNNGAPTCLGSAKVPTSQSDGLKGWSPPFVQTAGSGVLFGSSMELTCGWSVGPGSQLGKCPQVIEMPRWLQQMTIK